jgi:hypothetical protein
VTSSASTSQLSHTRPTPSRNNSQNSTARSTSTRMHPSPSLGSVLDPRLMDPTVKDEPTGTPLLHPTDPASMHSVKHNFAMSQPLYPILRNHGLRGNPGPAYSPYHRRDSVVTGQGEGLSPHLYRYPEPPSRSRNTSQEASSSAPSPSKTSSTPDPEVDEPADCGETSNNKLKGVYWPGMNIFDSATAADRRRRNQKKDASVISQLEASSLVVEPTELVFTTPEWELKKEKIITGEVHSSSSPWKPSPVKRETRVDISEAVRKPYFGLGQLDRRDYSTRNDKRAQGKLKFAPVVKKRKRRIQVFKDPDAEYEDDEQEEEPATFSRPSRMSYLTRGLDKENEIRVHNAPDKQIQDMPTFKGIDDPFLAAETRASDHHADDFRSADAVAEYHRQRFAQHQHGGMHTLNTLATAAAESMPYPTATNGYASHGGYHSHIGYTGYNGANAAYSGHLLNPYGLAYQSWQHQGLFQYQNSVPAATHQASHSRSLSATAGPTHVRNFSNGLGYGMSNNAYTFTHGGQIHAYASTDMPSMFATSTLWNNYAPTNNRYEPEQDHGSGGMNALGHHNLAPMSTSCTTGSSIHVAHAEELADSPGLHDAFIIAPGGHDIPIESVEDNKESRDEPFTKGEAEKLSEDEDRTITAPPTPDH